MDIKIAEAVLLYAFRISFTASLSVGMTALCFVLKAFEFFFFLLFLIRHTVSPEAVGLDTGRQFWNGLLKNLSHG